MTPQQRYRARHKALGLCAQCSQPAVGTFCAEHHARNRELRKWRRARARKFGKCIECGRKHYRTGTRCELCVLAAQVRSDKAAAAGLCSRCHTKPAAPDRKQCAQCQATANATARRRRQRKRDRREPTEALSKRVAVGQHAKHCWRNWKFVHSIRYGA